MGKWRDGWTGVEMSDVTDATIVNNNPEKRNYISGVHVDSAHYLSFNRIIGRIG